MTTIGYATLQIVPSLKGVSAAIDKQLDGTSAGRKVGQQFGKAAAQSTDFSGVERKAEESGKRAASKWGGAFKAFAGGLVAGIGTAGVAGIFATLDKGFDRLKSIDQARFKLQALGNDAGSVQTIMDNALASVKGTAFGLQDAATAAASAVAAGIKPGQDLTKYLKEVGDAAAVAGTNFDDMGSIFNKIQTSNKAYTDDLQQLSDRGLPIFQWLQKEYGVTADKLSDMVQKGEVDAAHFQAAIDKNIGGAAQKMGQSFDGAVDNMEASVARLGANFLTAILGGENGNELEGPTEAIGRLTTKFDEIGEWVKAHAPQIRQFFQTVAEDVKAVGEQLSNVLGFLAQHPHAIEAVVIAFAAWKTIDGVSSLVSSIGGVGKALDILPGKASSSAGLISKALGAVVIPAALLEILQTGATELHDKWQADFDRNWQNSRNAQDIGLSPRQPGVGDLGGAPAVGQTGPVRAPAPAVGSELRSKIAAGQLPGYSIGPGGAIIGPDGKPVNIPGMDVGGYTGKLPINKIAGFVHGDEHVIRATSRRSIENLYPGLLDFMNNTGRLPGFADGGLVPPDVAAAQALAGTKYSQGARTDCSGMVARVIDRTLGMPEAGLMSTKNAAEWLAERGFVPGLGGPGQVSVGWYDHGPNPNDGHMAMTLSDGRNAESGGSHGDFLIGAGAKGANSPGFDHHMFLPTVYGEGPAGSASSSPFAGGSAAAAATGGAAPISSGGAAPSSSGGGGGASINIPSSLSGFGSFAGDQLGTLLGDPKLGKLTSAAGSFIDGQVASALDVFGVPSSPGWLKGISTLVGGISIGGSGGSANPLAASPNGAGVPAPGDAANMHGGRAGQQPGPGVTYNITARDTEDAFVKAQRVEREKAAAKLSRF